MPTPDELPDVRDVDSPDLTAPQTSVVDLPEDDDPTTPGLTVEEVD